MSARKRVVLTLGRRGEGFDATQFAVCTELFASPCQYLMAIGLMAYIPNDTVFGRVEYVVKSHSNLCDTQTRSQMSRVYCHFFYDVFPQLVAELG